LEVLCRATGFLVKANNTMENRVFHSHLTWQPKIYNNLIF
jgi:hypothetical protein